MYHPLRFFGFIGIVLGVGGAIPIFRFLFFYLTGDYGGHVQSLMLGGILVLMGFIAFLFAILADLVNFNRRLVETTLRKVRRLEAERTEAEQAGAGRERLHVQTLPDGSGETSLGTSDVARRVGKGGA